MFKKTLIAAGTVLLLLTVVFGRAVPEYLETSLGWVQDSVRNQVPVEFEIERARKMIADLGPEVRNNMHLIAKEEIEVERIAKKIETLETRQLKGKASLQRIQQELDSGREDIRFGSTIYTSTEAKQLAKTRFDRFKTDDQTLRNLRQVLAARERALDAARKQLEGMMAAKQQLLAEVASLEARQKMNEVAQTTSDFSFDDSHLARTRELIQEIETRIQIEERIAAADLDYTDDVLLMDEHDQTEEDIADDIASYFADELPNSGALAEVSLKEEL